MSVNITEVDEYTANVVAAEDGDPRDAASLLAATQPLANRTFYFHELLKGGLPVDIVDGGDTVGLSLVVGSNLCSHRVYYGNPTAARTWTLSETGAKVGSIIEVINFATFGIDVRDPLTNVLGTLAANATKSARYLRRGTNDWVVLSAWVT